MEFKSLLRKLFIVAVVAVFVGYCVMAYRNYTTLPLPDFRLEEVDIMKCSRSVWESDPTYANERVQELAAIQYQPPAGGLKLPTGEVIPPDKVLSADDFDKIVRAYTLSSDARVPLIALRNPEDILALAEKDYQLRNPMPDYDLKGGEPITKEMIEFLHSRGLQRIPVVGEGETVAIEWGTMLMTVLIFLALVFALRLIIFDPLLGILDARNAELEEGQRLAKENRQEAKRLQDERKQRLADVRRAYMKQLQDVQHEALKEADGILRKARIEGHRMRDNATKEMRKAVRETEESLMNEVPALGEEIFRAVLGRNGESA